VPLAAHATSEDKRPECTQADMSQYQIVRALYCRVQALAAKGGSPQLCIGVGRDSAGEVRNSRLRRAPQFRRRVQG